MKGVILAGGLGTRLHPLTASTNKHLLPISNQPMIAYPIATLVQAGITEVLVVTSEIHAGDFARVLGNGERFGLTRLEYAYQDRANGGVADALACAEKFAGGDSIAVVLGDNLTDANIKTSVHGFTEGAMVFLTEVDHPEEFGVPEFHPQTGQIVRIVEKPSCPAGKLAATGIYLYDGQVFSYIRQIEASDRGELEISDVNNVYVAEGTLRWAALDGFWIDAGTFEGIERAERHWAEAASRGTKAEGLTSG